MNASEVEIVQRTVALLPWRSNITLLDRLDDPEIRLWYVRKAVEMGEEIEAELSRDLDEDGPI